MFKLSSEKLNMEDLLGMIKAINGTYKTLSKTIHIEGSTHAIRKLKSCCFIKGSKFSTNKNKYRRT